MRDCLLDSELFARNSWVLPVTELTVCWTNSTKYLQLIITARHSKDDGRLYFQSVHISGGGGRVPRSQIFGGGGGGGTWSQ